MIEKIHIVSLEETIKINMGTAKKIIMKKIMKKRVDGALGPNPKPIFKISKVPMDNSFNKEDSNLNNNNNFHNNLQILGCKIIAIINSFKIITTHKTRLKNLALNKE